MLKPVVCKILPLQVFSQEGGEVFMLSYLKTCPDAVKDHAKDEYTKKKEGSIQLKM